MYADKITKAIKSAVTITEKRRELQEKYNTEHGITPKTIQRVITPLIEEVEMEEVSYSKPSKGKKMMVAEEMHEYLTQDEVQQKLLFYEKEMKKAAKEMRFEDAAHARDLMRKYQQMLLAYKIT